MIKSFTEFTAYMKEKIPAALPQEYAGAEISIHTVDKPSGRYEGLTVLKPGQAGGYTVDLDLFYRLYLEGTPEKELVEKAAGIIQLPIPDCQPLLDLDYEAAKENLCLRLAGACLNKKMLKDVPHQKICDLYVLCYLTSTGPEGEVMGTIVTNQMLKKLFRVSEEKLFKDALHRTMERFPLETGQIGCSSMLYMTNEHHVNGAAAILYPDALKNAAEQLGGNCYLLPSSIHEIILIPARDDYDIEGMENMVRQINRAQVDPTEWLSDHVYFYNAQEDRLERAKRDA